MPFYNIQKVCIDEEVADYSPVKNLKKRLEVPFEIISGSRQLYQAMATLGDPYAGGKRVLHICRNRGAFIKECPGTRHYTCCGYQIVNIGSYCTMDCAYCILQAYFHPPVLRFFVNTDELFAELKKEFQSKKIMRYGTGEFTDSLIWEPLFPISPELVSLFSAQNRAILELKTKTVNIDGLKHLSHNRKTIVSWSLNTKRVIQNEERGVASLTSRLNAAKRMQEHGYPLAFHFDPIMIYENCEDEYLETIRMLFSRISPENIVWISLGAFRFIPSLKTIIEDRFPESKIVYGEFIPGLDGKMRYFKPLRIGIYKKMIETIRKEAPETVLYFCMEDDEVWQKCLGFTPEQKGGLVRMLDESARLHCGLSDSAALYGD